LFSFRARSQLSVADKTHRIASRYLIQSDYATPFEVMDEAAHVEMVFFENPIVNTTLSTLFLNHQDFQIILSAAEQTFNFTLLGNKTYLRLILTSQQAITHLKLSAQHVEIVHAQGVNNNSRLELDCRVETFMLTIHGDLTVNSCGDTLSWQGKRADNVVDIRYTKLSNSMTATLYQLQLPPETSTFPSLLQTLKRQLIHNHTKVYITFSTLGLSGYWLVPWNSSPLKQLRILGQLDQRNATLTLEETQSTLIGFTETWQPAFTVVEHYSTQANLATSLRLQGAESSLSTLKGQNPSIQLGLAYLATLPCETQGTVLLLESPQGHLEIHRFPNNEGQCITLNEIDYQVGPGSRLYAVGATEGRISGNRLLYDTDQRPVAIAFPMGLNASQLASVHGGVSVNGLQLEQLPKQIRLYFGNLSSPDIIPLHALQDTLLLPAKLPEVLSSEPPHRHRHHHQRRQVLVAASSALRPTPWTNWLVPALQLVYRGYQPISTWLLSIGKSSPPKQESSPRQPEYNPITEPDEYTAGHFQGLLWLLDLGVRTWMKNKYPKSSQVILSPAWEEATAQAGEWVDDFYHSLQQAARASGVSLALAAQPLETVTLVRQVAQQLYTGRAEEIEKLLKPVLHQVHQAIGNRATPKQADRFIAHCHHYRNQSVAIHRLQQQWASLPSGSGASPPLSPSRVTTAIPQLPVPLLSRVQDMT
ncbi:MAG: hypothetical protein AB2988_01405, partial [Candidatus Symbiodolus clandestinus]